jgi:hypothetical protein
MKNNFDPHEQKSERNEPLQPGLDPTTTGNPKQSDPSTDLKPGQLKEKSKPGYRQDS